MGGRGGKMGLHSGGGSVPGRGSSRLPDLPDNMGGRIRIFHDMMNAPSSRGDNDVRFTGDMHEAPGLASGYSAPGTYEVLKGGGAIDRVSGEVTAFNGRLFGIQHTDAGTYMVTDLRTGMLISGTGEDSIYAADRDIRTFNDWLSRESVRNRLGSAEKAFSDAHEKKR